MDSTKWKYKCPGCLGELQLTRKQYWSIWEFEDGNIEAVNVQESQPDVWTLYCENDHELSEFEAHEHEVVDMATRAVEEITKAQADPSWGEGKFDR